MKKFNKNQALTEISVYKETFIEKTNFNELHKQKEMKNKQIANFDKK